jgi:hypothetical protein
LGSSFWPQPIMAMAAAMVSVMLGIRRYDMFNNLRMR